jgi:hypothetical protein
MFFIWDLIGFVSEIYTHGEYHLHAKRLFYCVICYLALRTTVRLVMFTKSCPVFAVFSSRRLY